MRPNAWTRFLCLAGRPVAPTDRRWAADFVRSDPRARDVLLALPRALSFAVAVPFSLLLGSDPLVVAWLAAALIVLASSAVPVVARWRFRRFVQRNRDSLHAAGLAANDAALAWRPKPLAAR